MKSIFIKYGVIYGVIGFATTLLYYQGVLGMGKNFILGMVVLFLLLWQAGKEYKVQHQGFATFGELLKLFFLIISIGMIISLLLTSVWANIISDDQKSEIVARIVDSTMGMTKMITSDEAMLAQMQEDLEEEMTIEKVFGFKAIITNLFSALFGSIIFALIAAAIFKKVPKEV